MLMARSVEWGPNIEGDDLEPYDDIESSESTHEQDSKTGEIDAESIDSEMVVDYLR